MCLGLLMPGSHISPSVLHTPSPSLKLCCGTNMHFYFFSMLTQFLTNRCFSCVFNVEPLHTLHCLKELEIFQMFLHPSFSHIWLCHTTSQCFLFWTFYITPCTHFKDDAGSFVASGDSRRCEAVECRLLVHTSVFSYLTAHSSQPSYASSTFLSRLSWSDNIEDMVGSILVLFSAAFA